MKRALALCLTAILLWPLVLVAAGKGPTMIDMKSVLTNYGFKGGKFDDTGDAVLSIPSRAETEFGEIEKGASVDTPEEFLTATYFSPIKLSPARAAQVRRLLPPGKEGALKLCAMWLRKLAENQSLVITDKEEGVKTA